MIFSKKKAFYYKIDACRAIGEKDLQIYYNLTPLRLYLHIEPRQKTYTATVQPSIAIAKR